MLDLSSDLVAFLSEGCQLVYDADSSDIGAITLKGMDQLTRSTVEVFPGCQALIDDPYEDLEGLYQIEVVELIATSEDYDPEGLFCWIVALGCYGCIDPEHGDVFTFPGVSWTQIVEAPLTYLDAQWNDGKSARQALPWLHFPFQLEESEAVLEPYGERCRLHGLELGKVKVEAGKCDQVLKERNSEYWLEQKAARFPCPGVPVSEEEVLCCAKCRQAEREWLDAIFDANPALPATPNEHGWIKCPGCGGKFKEGDSNAFRDGIHLGCSQKIELVHGESRK